MKGKAAKHRESRPEKPQQKTPAPGRPKNAALPPVLEDEPAADLRIPDEGGARVVLLDLAKLNDDAQKAHDQYVAVNALAKEHKARWETLTLEIQEKLRACTHADLPLFDAEEREADLAKMKAADVVPAEGPGGDDVEDGRAPGPSAVAPASGQPF